VLFRNPERISFLTITIITITIIIIITITIQSDFTFAGSD
jgi:hypothetical protein